MQINFDTKLVSEAANQMRLINLKQQLIRTSENTIQSKLRKVLMHYLDASSKTYFESTLMFAGMAACSTEMTTQKSIRSDTKKAHSMFQKLFKIIKPHVIDFSTKVTRHSATCTTYEYGWSMLASSAGAAYFDFDKMEIDDWIGSPISVGTGYAKFTVGLQSEENSMELKSDVAPVIITNHTIVRLIERHANNFQEVLDSVRRIARVTINVYNSVTDTDEVVQPQDALANNYDESICNVTPEGIYVGVERISIITGSLIVFKYVVSSNGEKYGTFDHVTDDDVPYSVRSFTPKTFMGINNLNHKYRDIYDRSIHDHWLDNCVGADNAIELYKKTCFISMKFTGDL